MTVAQALAVAVMRLRGPSAPAILRESARVDAQRLLEEVLQVDRAWLIAHGGEELAPELLEIFGVLLDARIMGTPVAYLTHKAGFYGREFYVDERVLVPRPESENIVEAALAALRTKVLERRRAGRPPRLRLCDVGTGSGALGLTLLAELPDARATLVDISADALAVARMNAKTLGVEDRARFVESDLAAALDERFDCVIANLPYIPTRAVPAAPNPVSFEPRVALDGGDDGLDCYRRLLAGLSHIAAPGALALFEAAPPTIAPLADLCEAAFPAAHIEIHDDYAGLERFVTVDM